MRCIRAPRRPAPAACQTGCRGQRRTVRSSRRGRAAACRLRQGARPSAVACATSSASFVLRTAAPVSGRPFSMKQVERRPHFVKERRKGRIGLERLHEGRDRKPVFRTVRRSRKPGSGRAGRSLLRGRPRCRRETGAHPQRLSLGKERIEFDWHGRLPVTRAASSWRRAFHTRAPRPLPTRRVRPTDARPRFSPARRTCARASRAIVGFDDDAVDRPDERFARQAADGDLIVEAHHARGGVEAQRAAVGSEKEEVGGPSGSSRPRRRASPQDGRLRRTRRRPARASAH